VPVLGVPVEGSLDGLAVLRHRVANDRALIPRISFVWLVTTTSSVCGVVSLYPRGVPLYVAYGFETIEEGELMLTDGVKLEYASMPKSLNGSS
jgi:hypothetical protein